MPCSERTARSLLASTRNALSHVGGGWPAQRTSASSSRATGLPSSVTRCANSSRPCRPGKRRSSVTVSPLCRATCPKRKTFSPTTSSDCLTRILPLSSAGFLGSAGNHGKGGSLRLRVRRPRGGRKRARRRDPAPRLGRPPHGALARRGAAGRLSRRARRRTAVTRGGVMKAKLWWALVVALAGVAVYAGIGMATPPQGVSNPTWSPVIGRFADGIDASAKTDVDSGKATDFWQARLNTKGATDVQILENVIVPGGTFGWHMHPGPSLVIVRAGMLSVY